MTRKVRESRKNDQDLFENKRGKERFLKVTMMPEGCENRDSANGNK